MARPPTSFATACAASCAMSATTTRAPSCASALQYARPRPMPPPVTIATLFLSRIALLHLDVRLAYQAPPFVVVALHELRETFRAEWRRLERKGADALAHLGRRHGARDFAGEALDDLARRAGWGQHGEPRIRVIAREARLRDGGHVRTRSDAVRSCDAQEAHLAVALEGGGVAEHGEEDRYLARHGIYHRRCAAAVRHMHEVDARLEIE